MFIRAPPVVRRRLFTDTLAKRTRLVYGRHTSREFPIAIEGRSKPLLFRRSGNSIRLRSWAPRENYVKLNECNLTRDSCNAMQIYARITGEG